MDSTRFGKLSSRTFSGKEVEEIIPQLSELRIKVFYDFPYLYEGDLEYEKNYLQIYTKDQRSLVHLVFDGDKVVGATTGMPLSQESEEIKLPFIQLGFDINTIFYFGESILFNEYRGKGLGHQFFDVREKHALSLGFSTTTFCSVVRSENHPLKPVDYHSNEVFWQKRGYEKQDFTCEMSWLDRNETQETTKHLQFWMKQWK